MHIDLLTIHITTAIQTVVDQFLAQPYNFLYESDLQSALTAQLKLPTAFGNISVKTNNDEGKGDEYAAAETGIVRTEYPYMHSSSARCDIGIVDQVACELNKSQIWGLPLQAIVEIKLQKQPDINMCWDVLRDYKKIGDHFETTRADTSDWIGVAIEFFHLPANANAGKPSLIDHLQQKASSYQEYTQGRIQLKSGVMNGILIFGKALPPNQAKTISFKL